MQLTIDLGRLGPDPFAPLAIRVSASSAATNRFADGGSRSTLGKRQRRGEPFNRNAESRRIETTADAGTYRGRGVG